MRLQMGKYDKMPSPNASQSETLAQGLHDNQVGIILDPCRCRSFFAWINEIDVCLVHCNDASVVGKRQDAAEAFMAQG